MRYKYVEKCTTQRWKHQKCSSFNGPFWCISRKIDQKTATAAAHTISLAKEWNEKVSREKKIKTTRQSIGEQKSKRNTVRRVTPQSRNVRAREIHNSCVILAFWADRFLAFVFNLTLRSISRWSNYSIFGRIPHLLHINASFAIWVCSLFISARGLAGYYLKRSKSTLSNLASRCTFLIYANMQFDFKCWPCDSFQSSFGHLPFWRIPDSFQWKHLMMSGGIRLAASNKHLKLIRIWIWERKWVKSWPIHSAA